MNRSDLDAAVANAVGSTRAEAHRAIEAALDAIRDAIARAEEVRLPGFGTFDFKDYAAKQGRNPQTGAPAEIPAARRVRFRAGREFKTAATTGMKAA